MVSSKKRQRETIWSSLEWCPMGGIFTTQVIKMPFDVEISYGMQCSELGPVLQKV